MPTIVNTDFMFKARAKDSHLCSSVLERNLKFSNRIAFIETCEFAPGHSIAGSILALDMSDKQRKYQCIAYDR